jgi:formate dehydrogenase major subunit
MTNHWIDLKNSDCVFIIGGNPAENHPASMLWVNKAREERGAKLIVVDPRFTRSAAKADIYAPIRSGTDIVFLGAMINYAIQNKLYHEDYVKYYTNALTLIHPDYKGPAELEGYFSGWDTEKKTYNTATWQYQTEKQMVKVKEKDPATGEEKEVEKEVTVIKQATSLDDPNCVFALMARHYARYTPEMVERVCGTPKDKFLEVAKAYCATGAPDKVGTILYAMGQTQHTVGSQNVRIMAMLQLLLGNIGRPGGGVNALRGESNVQGSTDMAVLFHLLPGYLGHPVAATHPTFKDYNEKETPKTSYWYNKPKFLVSMLKAWWGDNATKDNDFCYDYLPKRAANYSWIPLFEAMYKGTIKGLWIMGQNPAVAGPNSRFERKALEKLDWLVAQELVNTETTDFWRAPGVNPADIKTEVFLLPAADAMEKEGTIVTSGRLIQYRPRVANPPGEAQNDVWILDQLCQQLEKAYAAGGVFPDPIAKLNWNYGDPPDFNLVAKEINGYWTADVTDDKGTVIAKKGDIARNFTVLRDDGNTACGNWVFSGYWAPADDGTGVTMPACKRRGQKDPGGLGTYPYWAFSWPVNRRIVYNRCSADPSGKPWDEAHKLIWWDAEKKTWTGYDVPDFAATKAPDAKAKPDGTGLDGLSGTDPFIMNTDGKGRLFTPSGMAEGPLPEHYEPVESPIKNLLSPLPVNPAAKTWNTDQGQDIGDNLGTPDKFPIICTTYRLVEHWQAGAMSRTLGWLAEAQPEMFVEISKELAAEKGIKNGDKVRVKSARGNITVVAVVTARFKPFTIDGRKVHHIGMPWHYGWSGLAVGDSANVLTPHAGDANTLMPEYKAFLVDIEKA